MSLFLSVKAGGQSARIDSLREEYDKIYGLDILLTNGRKYFPEGNPTEGHPFWRNNEFFLGNISVAGKTFRNQHLKYNIQKQEFILFYIDYNNQRQQIILNTLHLDSLQTDEYTFIKNRHAAIPMPVVQVIYEGDLSCYVGWDKQLIFQTSGGKAGLYRFTGENKNYYMAYEGFVHRFRNKSSFLKIFPTERRGTIKKYLAAQGLRFKKMNDNDLKQLMTYCDRIYTLK